MWTTTKAEATKKTVCGFQIVKCEEQSDCTGKSRKFWMLYNPVTDMDEAGFESYKEAFEYAKAHKIS